MRLAESVRMSIGNRTWTIVVCLALTACSDGAGAGSGTGVGGSTGSGSTSGSGGSTTGGAGGTAGAGNSSNVGGSAAGSGGEPCYWPVTMNFNIHSPEVTITKDAGDKYYVCLGVFASNPTTSWKSPGVRSYLLADTVGTIHPDGTETVGLQISEAIELEADPGFEPGTWNWSAGVTLASCPDGEPNDYDASWKVAPQTVDEGTYTIGCNQLPFSIDVELALQP